jgi:hypothetical protein
MSGLRSPVNRPDDTYLKGKLPGLASLLALDVILRTITATNAGINGRLVEQAYDVARGGIDPGSGDANNEYVHK